MWAPHAESVKLQILAPFRRSLPMQPLPRGYFCAAVEDAASCRYLYDLGGMGEKMRADPASRFQPEGVHGPSEAPSGSAFDWTDAGWRGLPLSELVFYEIHVGTFTSEGTFDAIISRLRRLRDLGSLGRRADALVAISWRKKLGLRRRFPLFGAKLLRWPPRIEAAGRRLSPRKSRRRARCRLQPSGSRRQLSRRFWTLLHRSLSHSLGPGGQFRW